MYISRLSLKVKLFKKWFPLYIYFFPTMPDRRFPLSLIFFVSYWPSILSDLLSVFYWSSIMSDLLSVFYWPSILSDLLSVFYWPSIMSDLLSVFYWPSIISDLLSVFYWPSIMSDLLSVFYRSSIMSDLLSVSYKPSVMTYLLIQELGLSTSFGHMITPMFAFIKQLIYFHMVNKTGNKKHMQSCISSSLIIRPFPSL